MHGFNQHADELKVSVENPYKEVKLSNGYTILQNSLMEASYANSFNVTIFTANDIPQTALRFDTHHSDGPALPMSLHPAPRMHSANYP